MFGRPPHRSTRQHVIALIPTEIGNSRVFNIQRKSVQYSLHQQISLTNNSVLWSKESFFTKHLETVLSWYYLPREFSSAWKDTFQLEIIINPLHLYGAPYRRLYNCFSLFFFSDNAYKKQSLIENLGHFRLECKICPQSNHLLFFVRKYI